MDSRTLLLMASPVLAICLASLFFTAFSTDEYNYLNTATQFAQGNFLHQPDMTTLSQGRFILYPFLLSFFFRVAGNGEWVAKAFNFLCMLATALLAYAFGRKLFGEGAGWRSGLLVASAPILLFFSTRMLAEPLFTLLSLAFVYSIHQAGEDSRFLPASGALLALVFLTRYEGLILAIPAALYLLWKNGFSWKFLAWAAAGAGVFLVMLSPWLYYSTLVSPSHSPLGFLSSFFSNQMNSGGGLALPDRIPDYLLVAPFLLGFASILWLDAYSRIRSWLRSPPHVLLGLAFLVPVLILELSARFLLHQPFLLRYLASATPSLALLLASSLVALPHATRFEVRRGRSWHSRNKRFLLACAVVLNLALALGAVAYFGGYAKHVAHRHAGLYAQANCPTVYSNIPNVLEYYVGKWNADSPKLAACVVVSSYEGGAVDVPSSYALAATINGVNVYHQ